MKAPQKGDQVLGCPHPGERIHWYSLQDEGGAEPTVQDTRTGELLSVRWIVLCDECDRRPGRPIAKASVSFVLSRDVNVVRVGRN